MFANVVYDCWISDLETCFKLLPLELYRELDVRSAGFGMEAEVTGKLLNRGFRPYEVPISYKARSREEGKKLTWKDGVEALWILSPRAARAGAGTASRPERPPPRPPGRPAPPVRRRTLRPARAPAPPGPVRADRRLDAAGRRCSCSSSAPRYGCASGSAAARCGSTRRWSRAAWSAAATSSSSPSRCRATRPRRCCGCGPRACRSTCSGSRSARCAWCRCSPDSSRSSSPGGWPGGCCRASSSRSPWPSWRCHPRSSTSPTR